MTPSGPRTERETVILMSEADDTASIWTASGVVYKRLLKLGWLPTEEGERHAVFTFPKDRIRLPRPFKRSARGHQFKSATPKPEPHS